MNKKQFHRILKRFGQGRATAVELSIIDQWYELLEDDNVPDPTSEELSIVENRLWQKIQSQTSPVYNPIIPQKTSSSIFYLWCKRMAVAAILVGIIAIIVFKFQQAIPQENAYSNYLPSQLQHTNNGSKNPQQIRLEDGSSITLQPNATLSYPLHFSQDKREVYLEGEAFFEVSKNPKRPFFVYCNNLVTHVLGTSFTIKPISGKNEIEVAVRSGRVEVFENTKIVPENQTKKSNGVVLLPNQKVLYNSSSRQFEASIVDAPLPLIAIGGSLSKIPVPFSFAETPLSVVLKSLEEAYGIEITAEKESLYNCPFTGDITGGELYTKLDIINKVLGTTYEIKGIKILIKGKGCE